MSKLFSKNKIPAKEVEKALQNMKDNTEKALADPVCDTPAAKIQLLSMTATTHRNSIQKGLITKAATPAFLDYIKEEIAALEPGNIPNP